MRITNGEILIWIVIYFLMMEDETDIGLIFIIGGIISVVALVVSIIVVERKDHH